MHPTNPSSDMIYRKATLADIPQLSALRLSVTENRLSNPNLVAGKDYIEYLSVRGRGWVCETEGKIVGFSIGDLVQHNVWALFIQPGYEGKGIGQKLLTMLLDWYFASTTETIWLSTAPGTRAEQFYRRFGFTATGIQANGEVRFELRSVEWKRPGNL